MISTSITAERRMIMTTEFNTQVGDGEYRFQFKTDNKEHYLIVKCCIEGILNWLRQAAEVDE